MTCTSRALAFASVLVLGCALAWGQSAEERYAPCSTCHDTVAAAFTANPHHAAVPAGAQANACQSCHGDGTQHAEEGDPALIMVPRGKAGAGVCLSCHGAAPALAAGAAGAHSRAAVDCFACHTAHAATDALLAKPATELCASCHGVQAAQARKPYAHRLEHGEATCVACHNPHGGRGRESLKRTRAGEVACLSCHAEKAGPFVFNHPPANVREECTACHEPHGSANPAMLTRARVHLLCLECHTTLPPTNLGSQPPSFHDIRSPRYQNCTTCHVAVHGSNTSPMLLK